MPVPSDLCPPAPSPSGWPPPARRPRGDGDGAALRHRVAGIHHQVEESEFELVGIDQGGRQPRGEARLDPHARPDRALQEVGHPAHQPGEVDRLGLQVLAPGEGEHALRQRRAALGTLDGVVEQAQQAGVLGQALAQEFEAAQHRHQQVVEVVGDAAGELAHRLHLLGLGQGSLRLRQRLFGAAALGDVAGYLGEADMRTVLAADRIDDDAGPEAGPIAAQAPALGRELALRECGGERPGRHVPRPVLLGVEAREVGADDLLGLVSLDTAGAGIPVRHHPVAVEHVDRVVGHALEQQAVALLAGAQGRRLPRRVLGEAPVDGGGREREDEDQDGHHRDADREAGLAEPRLGGRRNHAGVMRDRQPLHAGEVHPRDGEAHDHGGGDAQADAALGERQPDRRRGGHDRHHDGAGDPGRIVVEDARQMHRRHAGIVHRDDAEPGDEARERDAGRPGPRPVRPRAAQSFGAGSFGDREAEGRHGDRQGEGQEREPEIVGDLDARSRKASIATKCIDQTPPPSTRAAAISQARRAHPDAAFIRSARSRATKAASIAIATDRPTRTGS